ncbi:MAG: hypothetical protein CMK07_00375 [Ponticaulis sp.]|nr:hypothetical protein [Ponticaulis sp.]
METLPVMKMSLSALLLTSALLTFSHGAAMAEDEAVDATDLEMVETTEAVEAEPVDAGPEIETPEVALIGEAVRIRDLLTAKSKEVLAADGDRSTSENRKQISLWLARMASNVSKGVPALVDAQEELDHALSKRDETLAALKSSLDTELAAANETWLELRELDLDPEVRRAMNEAAQEMASLKTMSEELEVARKVMIELSFEEPVTDGDRLLFTERLLAFEMANEVALVAEDSEVGTDLKLVGQVPASMSALELRAKLAPIWNPLGSETEDGEDILALPEPSFIAITLE